MGLGHGMARIEVWVWKGGGGITIIISVGMIVYMFSVIFPRTFNLIDCDSPFFEVIEIGM